MELGGNITLSGFNERDFTEMIVVKKLVGQYARKFTDTVSGFSNLKVTLKAVHSDKMELNAHATVNGKELVAEETHSNLYVALDSVLKHVLEQARDE